MLRLVDRWWPMETNVGPMTLAEFRDRYGVLRYSAEPSTSSGSSPRSPPRRTCALVNGGYVVRHRAHRAAAAGGPRRSLVERLEPSDLATRFDALDPALELALRPFLAAAQRAMDRLGCEVVLRSFDPAGAAGALPGRPRRPRSSDELRATRDRADELWAGVLDALDRRRRATDRPAAGAQPPQPAGPPGHRAGRPGAGRLAVEALYGQALLLGLPPDPAGRRGPAQPFVPRPARPGRARGRHEQ